MNTRIITSATLVTTMAVAWFAWGRAAPVAPSAPTVQRRPNILFIVADDLRAGFGDPMAHTPNSTRSAERGVTFGRAYAQYPVCNPSRVSFLTGLRPETTGILGNDVYLRTKLPDIVTLPQLFRQHGYFTASLGKIFHRGLTMEDAKTDLLEPRAVAGRQSSPPKWTPPSALGNGS